MSSIFAKTVLSVAKRHLMLRSVFKLCLLFGPTLQCGGWKGKGKGKGREEEVGWLFLTTVLLRVGEGRRGGGEEKRTKELSVAKLGTPQKAFPLNSRH